MVARGFSLNWFVHPVLQIAEHRPWPLPRRPWIMEQTWHDLLFAHWPLPEGALRPLVPAQLELDVFGGHCWVGVVPFRMSDIHARGLFPISGLSQFPELNVRTYVNYGGKPGVYFFSLDAANLPAVWTARAIFHLPYFYAAMSSQDVGGEIHYQSRRQGSATEFRGRYRPIADVCRHERGSIAHWLTERYCLYTVHRGQVYRGEIHHRPWPLQDAKAEIEIDTMAAAAGISLPASAPLLHFARRLQVLIWSLRPAE